MTLEDSIRQAVADVVERVMRPVEQRLAAIEQAMGRTERDEYLTPEQAGEVAKVTAATVRSWVKSKRLHLYRAGRELRIKRSELADYLAGGTDKPSAADIHDHVVRELKRRAGR